MIQVTIDCTEIHDQEDFHDVFAQRLRLPKWYGRNLDALHDCLTDFSVPVTISLLHVQTLINRLGSYGRAAINCMEHAERENSEMLTLNML